VLNKTHHNDIKVAIMLRDWKTRSAADMAEVFFEQDLKIETRENYIAHRDALKALIRSMATHQKQMKARMHAPGGDENAQSRKEFGSSVITQLIEIRRAGKDWSKARRGARDVQNTASAA